MEMYKNIKKRLLKYILSFSLVITCSNSTHSCIDGGWGELRFMIMSPDIIDNYAWWNFIYYSDKPIHRRGMAVRTGIHFAALLALVLFCAWQFEWFSFNHVPSILTFLGLFLAVYSIIWLASFISDLLDERKINKRLMELNSSPIDKNARNHHGMKI